MILAYQRNLWHYDFVIYFVANVRIVFDEWQLLEDGMCAYILYGG